MFKWIVTDKLVRRLADGASIPVDPSNRDWRRVLEWVAAGNVIAAADPPPAPATKAERVQAAFQGNELAQALVRREARTRGVTILTVLQELAGELP